MTTTPLHLDAPPTRLRASRAAPRRLTPRQDAITTLLGTWLMVGLFVDGWAHNNLGATLESFFTPWHGVFYSGFTACGAWLVWMSFGPGARGRGREVIPVGYGLGLVGLVVFAVGGVGDLLWHTALGIETDIDALFSPTHLLLFLGILLIVGSPFRAAWAGDPTDAAPTLRQFAPVLASPTLMAALVSFFFMYWSVFTNTSPMAEAIALAAAAGEYAGLLDYGLVIDGVASALTTTIVLLVPLLLAVKRWQVPVGTATILCSGVAVLKRCPDRLPDVVPDPRGPAVGHRCGRRHRAHPSVR